MRSRLLLRANKYLWYTKYSKNLWKHYSCFQEGYFTYKWRYKVFPQKRPKPFDCLPNKDVFQEFLTPVAQTGKVTFVYSGVVLYAHTIPTWSVLVFPTPLSPLSPRCTEVIRESPSVSIFLCSLGVWCGKRSYLVHHGPLTKTSSISTTHFNTRGKSGFLL